MATRDGVAFPRLCALSRLPEPVAEYRFAAAQGRDWRFDFAWPKHLVALEVEGGAWTGGRHVRGAGFVKDIEKYNAAQLLGWMVLRCTPRDLQSVGTFDLLQRAFATRRPE